MKPAPPDAVQRSVGTLLLLCWAAHGKTAAATCADEAQAAAVRDRLVASVLRDSLATGHRYRVVLEGRAVRLSWKEEKA